MPPIIHNEFNPVLVPLEQHNLIEASAGTGKTYSIALLVLRLIVQKGYSIDQILMVTFTRDAAAEMELRVRGFMRTALMAATGRGGAADENIQEILNELGDNALAAERLQQELARFDKASIFTIHGFCARTLAEFAFESGQLFGASTMEPDRYESLLADAFNQAWRKIFTILDPDVLRCFMEAGYNRSTLYDLIKGHLNGKRLYLPNGGSIEISKMTALAERIRNAEAELIEAVKNEIKTLQAGKEELKGNARNHLLPLIDENDIDGIIEKIKSRPGYIIKTIDPEILKKQDEIDQLVLEQTTCVSEIFTSLAIDSCMLIEERLRQIRMEEDQITFDDMIAELHKAVCGSGENMPPAGTALASALRKRYKAVFIDEFQDTDRLQYELFATVFQNPAADSRHIVFYIGDPKQSIYAFRKADLQTYFRARESVQHVHRMNHNYRSTSEYIQAMNEFFQPEPEFDVFNNSEMLYYPVSVPVNQDKSGVLHYGNIPLSAMRILGCKKKENVYPAVLALVKQWLTDSRFNLVKNGTGHAIKPAQVGILVRSRRDGRILRKLLAKNQIPAVTVADQKVLDTEEASDLLYILKAVQDIHIGTIRRALLTQTAGYNWYELEALDDDMLLTQFRQYQDTWKSKGVYVLLRMFLRDSQAVQRKWSARWPNPDRHLSNLFQLMEMLHAAEQDKNYKPAQLLAWLQRGIEGQFENEDAYLQRIESDEQAVKIVTIHSSKGLEYDLIIAPFLDMSPMDRANTRSLYLNESYYTADKKLLDPTKNELSRMQEQQENLRLLYVAITRAKYHACIFTTANAKKESTLQRLLNPILKNNKQLEQIRLVALEEMHASFMQSALLEIEAPELADTIGIVLPSRNIPAAGFTPIPAFQIPDLYWQKVSYTSLNPGHELPLRSQSEPVLSSYDEFIFRDLRKGAQSGLLLHDLLENIDFSNDRFWESAIETVIKRYPGNGIATEKLGMLKELFHILTTVPLSGSTLVLSKVKRQQRLSEFEFDLPLTDIDWSRIPDKLESGKIPLRIKRDQALTGILNGKIDLFFEHEGRYYLLDWKSNHLGNRVDDYHHEALGEAMEMNNYCLQYYLYCLALYRYLKLRMPGFDYENQFGGVYYLFIRGMRVNSRAGIYFHKPRLEDILMLEERLLKVIEY